MHLDAPEHHRIWCRPVALEKRQPGHYSSRRRVSIRHRHRGRRPLTDDAFDSSTTTCSCPTDRVAVPPICLATHTTNLHFRSCGSRPSRQQGDGNNQQLSAGQARTRTFQAAAVGEARGYGRNLVVAAAVLPITLIEQPGRGNYKSSPNEHVDGNIMSHPSSPVIAANAIQWPTSHKQQCI